MSQLNERIRPEYPPSTRRVSTVGEHILALKLGRKRFMWFLYHLFIGVSRGNKGSLIAFPASLWGPQASTFRVQLHYPTGAVVKSRIACLGGKRHSLILSFQVSAVSARARARSWVFAIAPGATEGRKFIALRLWPPIPYGRQKNIVSRLRIRGDAIGYDAVRCDTVRYGAMRCDAMRGEDINTLFSVRPGTRAPPGVIWR